MSKFFLLELGQTRRDAKDGSGESDENLNKNREGPQIFEPLQARIGNRSAKSGKPDPLKKGRGESGYLRRSVFGKS